MESLHQNFCYKDSIFRMFLFHSIFLYLIMLPCLFSRTERMYIPPYSLRLSSLQQIAAALDSTRKSRAIWVCPCSWTISSYLTLVAGCLFSNKETLLFIRKCMLGSLTLEFGTCLWVNLAKVIYSCSFMTSIH